MIAIIHRTCGGVCAGFSGVFSKYIPLESKYYHRLDGTQPERGSFFREICPNCGDVIQGASDLRIDPETQINIEDKRHGGICKFS